MPRQSKPPAGNKPTVIAHDPDRLEKATGTREVDLQTKLINQALSATPSADAQSEEARNSAINATFAAMAGLAPRNETEGMLVAQMVATHNAALLCLRRGMQAETVPLRELELKHAEKLMGLFARQLEALDKFRGKGQQKITVEHVNVHAGGQAIVGSHVAAQPNAQPGPPQSQPAPPALSDHSADSLPLIDGQLAQRSAKTRARAR